MKYSQSPNWNKALTLKERVKLLIQNPDNTQKDIGKGKKFYERWKSQKPFETDSYFIQRLESAGISREQFFEVLCRNFAAYKPVGLQKEPWIVEIANPYFSATVCDEKWLTLDKAAEKQKALLFLKIIEPPINHGRSRLKEDLINIIQTRQNVPFDLLVVENIFFERLASRLSTIINRTMILELNVARLKGTLVGETAEIRFQSFIEFITFYGNALAILAEYPVLARQVTLCIQDWQKFSAEFTYRLCRDWDILQSSFGSEDDLGALVGLEYPGDNHQKGQSVIIAKFSCGKKILYKPRSLSVDIHFYKFLQWLNKRGFRPAFRDLKIIDRGTYGWEEFVDVEGCGSIEQIYRFYEQMGAYLAILYLLGATDFHIENLIASGEHPVLVDLECLFHPKIESSDYQKPNNMALSSITSSVLRTGLLPQPIWIHGDSESIDFSGMGDVDGKLSPVDIPYFDKIGTDEMHVERKRFLMKAQKNQPTLNGVRINSLNHVQNIMKGFQKMYVILMKYRDELMLEVGPLSSFKEDEVRVLFRPTLTYAKLLYESCHPDELHDAIERELLFDNLWRPIRNFPYLALIIESEKESLQNGDIPKYTTYPNSRHIYLENGNILVDFFNETGLSNAFGTVQKLCIDDLERQTWFIQANLAALSSDTSPMANPRSYVDLVTTSYDKEDFLSEAQLLGNKLEKLSLQNDSYATWIGLSLTPQGHWSVIPSGIDLYNGLSGISLFFAYLGHLVKNDRYSILAKKALNSVRLMYESDELHHQQIGAFYGWGGVIYLLTHLGVLLGELNLLDEAEAIVKKIPPIIKKDNQFDIITGSAGCIMSLLALYHIKPSDITLTVAEECGKWLVGNAKRLTHGIAWINPVMGSIPLTGFSHGAAGIALSLLELSALTGRKDFKDIALGGLEYEQRLFSYSHSNWPDLREVGVANSKGTRFGVSWCHGAPGIGLSRLAMLQYLDGIVHSEIGNAINATLSKGFGYNHSLCHGDLGNLELLIQGQKILGDTGFESNLCILSSRILNSIKHNGPVCGLPLEIESPGLMTGLAGIGYGLLRLADCYKVPSILTLEPPLAQQSLGI